MFPLDISDPLSWMTDKSSSVSSIASAISLFFISFTTLVRYYLPLSMSMITGSIDLLKLCYMQPEVEGQAGVEPAYIQLRYSGVEIQADTVPFHTTSVECPMHSCLQATYRLHLQDMQSCHPLFQQVSSFLARLSQTRYTLPYLTRRLRRGAPCSCLPRT